MRFPAPLSTSGRIFTALPSSHPSSPLHSLALLTRSPLGLFSPPPPLFLFLRHPSFRPFMSSTTSKQPSLLPPYVLHPAHRFACVRTIRAMYSTDSRADSPLQSYTQTSLYIPSTLFNRVSMDIPETPPNHRHCERRDRPLLCEFFLYQLPH